MRQADSYYGRRTGERYPAGTPLGGRFRPAGIALPSIAQPSKVRGAAEQIRRVTEGRDPGGDQVRAFHKRVGSDLTESGRGWARRLGASPQEVDGINRAVAAHAASLLATQAAARPELVASLSRLKVKWVDFGNEPIDAFVDHKTGTLELNPRTYLDPSREESRDGAVLKAVTHEFSHAIDRGAGDGQSAFTDLFEPLHRFLGDYATVYGTPRWLNDTKLAYPATGYWGAVDTSKTDKLSMEYVAVLSEMHLHDPARLAGLDRHLAENGYPGPPLRETMSRVWGVAAPPIPPLRPRPVGGQDMVPIDGRSFGLGRPGGIVRWDRGRSRPDPLSRLVS